jgi:arylformamidase
VARGLVRSGVAVAIVNYRLCPAVEMGQIVEDAREACLWLFRNSKPLGVDASRIQISGHSAGGHLTAMLWATRWQELATDLPLPTRWIHSGIAISGLFELEPLVHTPVNSALGIDVSEARGLSPALLPRVCDAPLLLAVGGLESAEYQRQGECLERAWRYGGTAPEPLVLRGCNHFSILDELADDNGSLLSRALALWQ